jgi:hypothetical protein
MPMSTYADMLAALLGIMTLLAPLFSLLKRGEVRRFAFW